MGWLLAGLTIFAWLQLSWALEKIHRSLVEMLRRDTKRHIRPIAFFTPPEAEPKSTRGGKPCE